MTDQKRPLDPGVAKLAAEEIAEQVMGKDLPGDDIDGAKLTRALNRVPELTEILIRAMRGELTKEEARKLAAPHLKKLREIYPDA